LSFLILKIRGFNGINLFRGGLFWQSIAMETLFMNAGNVWSVDCWMSDMQSAIKVIKTKKGRYS